MPRVQVNAGEVVKSNTGERPYTARFADGSPGGTHVSVREAQLVVERALGGVGRVHWEKEERIDGTDVWLGTTT